MALDHCLYHRKSAVLTAVGAVAGGVTAVDVATVAKLEAEGMSDNVADAEFAGAAGFADAEFVGVADVADVAGVADVV